MTRKKIGSSKLVKKLEAALAKPRKKDEEMTARFKKLQKELAGDSMNPICERNGDEVGDIPTEGKCVVCQSVIVERRVEEFNPMFGPPVDGPGSEKQFHIASAGYHCSKCGLKYDFIPPADIKK